MFRLVSLLKRVKSGGKVESFKTNTYFNMIGSIWMQEIGAYIEIPHLGVSIVVDTPGSWCGTYFNR